MLAAVLQLMPLVRTVFINPAAESSFAFILRWGVGSAAAMGAYDAFSAASTPYFRQPFQTNIILTVGTYYTNNLIVTNVGTDPGAYFALTNSFGQNSGQIGGNGTTTVCLPAGLTLKCFDTATTKAIRAAIYGTPTTVSNTVRVNVNAGFSGAGDIYTNLFFTVLAGSSPPVITNQPVSVTNVAGGSATFSVLAGGTAPLSYQWYFNTNTSLANATNTSLGLTGIRAAQAGTYSVIVTNVGGAKTSSVAFLIVTNPASPAMTGPTSASGLFQFTFTPAVGLTNSVQRSDSLDGSGWTTFTNVPPPASASPITVMDPLGDSNRFFRVQIIP